MSKEKQHTFIVMHGKGELVGGKHLRAYEEFKSVMTDELQLKVDRGYLELKEIKSTSRKAKK